MIFGLLCELLVFNSGSVHGLDEDFHVYLYTDSEQAHTRMSSSQDPNFIVWIKPHSNLCRVTQL